MPEFDTYTGQITRSRNRVREDARRATRRASPRVGDTHRRRACAWCGYVGYATYLRFRRYGVPIEDGWLCQSCSLFMQATGRLQRAPGS